MFKKIVLLIIIICIAFPLFSAKLDMKNAEPYEDSEFPKFALDIRRGEILFFGSIPLTFAGVSLVSGLMDQDLSFWDKVGYACGVSAFIVVTDYIIGIIKK